MRIRLITYFITWVWLNPVIAAELTCDTTFTGSDAAHPLAWDSFLNWTNGIPAIGANACVIDSLRDRVNVPSELNVQTVKPIDGAAAGEFMAACCVANSCSVTNASSCDSQGGYFHPQITSCFPQTCSTGACCDAQFQCDDLNPFNQPMTLTDCNALDQPYRGGVHCSDPDPCGFQAVPDGFEIVAVTSPEQETGENYRPRLNECGEIVFGNRSEIFNNNTYEVFHYDNGSLTQVTNDQDTDNFPDINNQGEMVWGTAQADLPESEVRYTREWLSVLIGPGNAARINDEGDAGWDQNITNCEDGPSHAVIWYYDGDTSNVVFDDGESNQAVVIGRDNELAWTSYHFTNGCNVNWTSDIMVRDSAHEVFGINHSLLQSQQVAMDSAHAVAWDGHDGAISHVEKWNGTTSSFVQPGTGPAVGTDDDLAFAFKTSTSYYQIRLMRGGQTYRITSKIDQDNQIHNSNPSINDQGELAWSWHPNSSLIPSGIKMLRRIRTGDIDLDMDVDRDDFARFPLCYTGPGNFDRLCECRFLDIDHDRDVDADDYAEFLSYYSGPLEDCDDNGNSDLDDLLFGAALDCNRNGIPDSCDVASGSSPDADENGIPDDCVYDLPQPIWREILPVWTNRFLTMIPRNEGKSVALRVTLTSLHHVSPPYGAGPTVAYTAFEGAVRWVGPPTLYVESNASGVPFWTARLQCNPHYQVWDGIDLLHVTGPEVVPSSEYHVQTVSIGCAGREANCPWMAEPVRIKTSRWGDVEQPYNPPSATAQPDLADVSALVSKFRGSPGAPGKARAIIAPNDAYGDITPNTLTVDVGFTHISSCVDAFRGAPYPGRPGHCAGAGGPCGTDSHCTGANTPPCTLVCP